MKYLRPLILALILFSGSIYAGGETASGAFDKWRLRTWNGDVPQLKEPEIGVDGVRIPLRLPERTEVVYPASAVPGGSGVTHLQFVFKVPRGLPDSLFCSFFTKDNDHLWRQIRMKFPDCDENGLVTVKLPVRGMDAVKSWQSMNHKRPWTSLTATGLIEYGCIFELDTGHEDHYEGDVFLISVNGLKLDMTENGCKIRDLSFSPRTPETGEIMELSFRLDCWSEKPFDSDRTRINCTVTDPDGRKEETYGFYFEDFQYDEGEWDKTKCLTPAGEPMFKVRYCPRSPGHYSLDVNCEIDGLHFQLPLIEFTAVPSTSGWHGFVNVEAGGSQYFTYDDGTLFQGIGINVRSPYDNRYREIAPYSLWQDMGLSVYPRLFKRYKEAGINLIEVWMSSWWLALEWINDAPGFHGVGHYNQYRAWMLDYIMNQAAENGIHVILVINNHGKFAMHYDTEWGRNPYNKKNGGYLERCEDYYTDLRARTDTKKLLNYINARWGAYSNLLAWKLFTEVDLTGPHLDYYRHPSVAAWHAEMATHLKKIAIFKHPVTTHWMLSYKRINEEIANLSELDFLSTDVYYNLGEGTRGMVELLHGSRNYGINHHKPLVITEFGGSSYGDNMTNLVNQVTAGSWTGFFDGMGIIPMYWWFALVEEKELYGNYIALSAFSAGEDRRGMKVIRGDVPGTSVTMNLLAGKDRILGWFFDRDYYYSMVENCRPAVIKQLKAVLPALEKGNYTVEFWDSEKGKIISSVNISPEEEKEFEVVLPDFLRHTALKVVRNTDVSK